MRKLTQEQLYDEWTKFYNVFEKLGLTKFYDMDALKKEMMAAPCAVSEEMGTAYKGALLVHINLVNAMASRIAKMMSGTFDTLSEESLLKVLCIMHLSKRLVYEENDNEWEIKNRGKNFKFAKVEGCIKGGARSALEALNNGVKLTPIEFEAITCLDNEEENSQASFQSIMTKIVKDSNEFVYAIEKERYNKTIKQ